jgi:mono/diheme cytochrome c family protein
VTEVPEHLLKRSRDRRAALGLGGAGGDVAATPAEPATTGAEVEQAAPIAAAKPAAAAPAEVEPKAPEPLPPYVEAALTRKRIPFWVMPILGLLPVWAILYAGSLSPAKVGQVSQLDLGAEIFAARCASCHGGGGGGGVGRPLAGGEVLKTFPDIESQLEFVAIGSDGVGIGNGYGDPNREGGQHIAGSYNGNKMPAFREVLTDAELFAVVRHERETLSGEKLEGKAAGEGGTRLTSDGKPYLDAAGKLITPSGEPLLDEKGKLTIEIAGASSGAAGGQPSGQ